MGGAAPGGASLPQELVARWLERITQRLEIEDEDVFPTDELLDHVPRLIDGIAGYLRDPAEEITADVPVVAKAMELGALRHEQGFDAHQILREYEILGGILFHFLGEASERVESAFSAQELLGCGQRLFRAVTVIQQTTTTHFLRLADGRVRRREEQLEGFNRTVSHELKNRIGALTGAVEMLREDWVADDAEERARFLDIVDRNTEGMGRLLEDLLTLSRTDRDRAPERRILLSDAAAEVVRQLRDFAAARSVEVQIAEDLPRVVVPGAEFELCLSNYLTNAIKYSDRSRPDRWARIEGRVEDGAPDRPLRVVVRVRDNGIGVAEEERERLFRRHYRARRAVEGDEEGTGLGLSIVRETAASAGGDAWVEWHGDETVFALAFPVSRSVQPQAG